MEEHAQKLEAIFKDLEEANCKIQPEKCVFATDRSNTYGTFVHRPGFDLILRKLKPLKSILSRRQYGM
jgi:hypothetical protein